MNCEVIYLFKWREPPGRKAQRNSRTILERSLDPQNYLESIGEEEEVKERYGTGFHKQRFKKAETK